MACTIWRTAAAIGDNLLPARGDLREFELPRPIFTGSEKTAGLPIVYTSRHAELQVRTDLTEIIRSPSSPAQLEAARARLTPFLRDTLVGLNYAYYEPPGAQVLHNNPLFVRSHDFTASSVQGIEHVWDAPELVGVGVTAGGGAYLLGSLADLPYALASMEQDFISPANVQALIWKEIVPEFLVDAVLPRWWGIRQDEMHAAALYQRVGEELLIASASNPQLREKVLGILSDRMSPARLEETEQALQASRTAPPRLFPRCSPADTFFLAAEYRSKSPGAGCIAGEMPAANWMSSARRDPSNTNPGARSRKTSACPTWTWRKATPAPCSTWESSPPLARLMAGSLANPGNPAISTGRASPMKWATAPAMLNVLVPNLTRRMVANIFATNTDDWPALLRAIQKAGDEFRQGKVTVQGIGTTAGQVGSLPIAAAGSSN